jgi:hypothetical protein
MAMAAYVVIIVHGPAALNVPLKAGAFSAPVSISASI